MGAKAKCKKCGDVIESKHRHDFVWCKCQAIFVDGGNDYTRWGGEPGALEWLDGATVAQSGKAPEDRAVSPSGEDGGSTPPELSTYDKSPDKPSSKSLFETTGVETE